MFMHHLDNPKFHFILLQQALFFKNYPFSASRLEETRNEMHVSKKSGLKSRVYGVFTTQSDIKLMVKVLEQGLRKTGIFSLEILTDFKCGART